MSERLTLQDLIDLLSEKQNITKKDAETFLRELVALISETIEEKDFVRIKDFGTFKLTPVSARKSVNVNTGETIEIKAHYRLSFVPDKVLREGVNKPFAHFESIQIDNDEVTFEDKIEAPAKKAPEKKTEVKKEEPKKETPKVAPVTKKEESKVVVEEPKKEETIEANKIDEVLQNTPDVETLEKEVITASDLEREAELADLSSFIAKDVEDEVKAVPAARKERVVAPESKPIAKRPVARQFDDEDDEDDYADYEYVLAQQKKKRNMWIAVGAAILLLVGGCIWWYSEQKNQPVAIPYAQNNAKVKISEDTNTKTDTTKADVDATDIVTSTNEVEAVVPVAEEPKEITPPPAVVEKKPEAGAREIEVLPKETMRVLGLKYFGAEPFWVYIFEENRDKISRPDAVFAGMKLIIPPASKYGIDPNDDASVKKARRQELKLFGQFSDK